MTRHNANPLLLLELAFVLVGLIAGEGVVNGHAELAHGNPSRDSGDAPKGEVEGEGDELAESLAGAHAECTGGACQEPEC